MKIVAECRNTKCPAYKRGELLELPVVSDTMVAWPQINCSLCTRMVQARLYEN